MTAGPPETNPPETRSLPATSTADRWPPGKPVLLRYQRAGELRGVRPCRVVEDTADHTLLWLVEGTEVRFPRSFDGRPIRDVPMSRRYGVPWHVGPDKWAETNVLILLRPNTWHSVYLFFTPEGRFRNWYVNTETPAHRWDDGDTAGLDTDDLELDVVITPDRSYELKDEDELEAAFAAGELPADRVARVRLEADRARAEVAAARWPFDGTWTDFRPDPAWTPPPMPSHWDRPVDLAAFSPTDTRLE